MNRRLFLKNGSLTGLVFAPFTLPATMAATTLEKKADPFPLLEATIDDLQKLLAAGTYTSAQITRMYLDRIRALDHDGPALRSVIEINRDALKIASNMDAERKAGRLRGPLHGIPVLLKDNIDTGDGMMTTAGSLALEGNRARQDAFIVRKLRQAGAVILGKTNLSEWANFRSTNSTSGWSSRGGQTKNPVVLTRNPSGSSSGSAVSVAANLCAAAVGTETNGSIIAPSSNCGIVGIKPTVGVLSRSGIIPISKTQDTPGPMARTVKDAALLLQAMAGRDAGDEAQNNHPGETDYTAGIADRALEGKRIGMEASFLKGRPEVVDLYKAAIEKLRQAGATVVEVELLKAVSEAAKWAYTVLCYEFKDGVNRYLQKAAAPVKSLTEVIAFNNRNAATVMPYFGQEILLTCEEKGDLKEQEYRDALARSRGAGKIIDDRLKEQELDAICGVSMGPACLIDLVNGDYGTGFYFATPAAIAGYPHITVPMGKVHELPIGFSLMGTARSDADLIGMAHAFEQATRKREAPQFLPG